VYLSVVGAVMPRLKQGWKSRGKLLRTKTVAGKRCGNLVERHKYGDLRLIFLAEK